MLLFFALPVLKILDNLTWIYIYMIKATGTEKIENHLKVEYVHTNPVHPS